MKRLMVYIAGPISRGDLRHNIEQASKAFKALAEVGIAALCPHWSAFSGTVHTSPGGSVYAFATADGNGMSHADWLAVDLEFVRRSDAILRLPGESSGADIEVKAALDDNIPVFYSLAEVLSWKRSME